MGRRLLRWLTILLALPFAYVVAAAAGALLPGPQARFEGGPPVTIGLLRGPIHYDFLLPASEDLRARFGFALAQGVPVDDPRVQWLVVGWGSRAFYTSTGTYADVRLSTVLQAALGDDATLHLDVAGDVRDIPDILYLDLTETQLSALTESLLASLSRDAKGQPLALPVAPFGPNDAFYAAEGRFSALNTCNAWLGRMLRQAGVSFGLWTPLPQSVTFAARFHAGAQDL